MPPKGRRAERKAARNRRSAAASHTRQIDSDSGEDGNPPLVDNNATKLTSIDYEEAFDDETQPRKIYPSAPRNESNNSMKGSENSRADNEMTPFDYDSITHAHILNSALLRLPAEIRENIWKLAFGYRTVHPRALRGNVDWQPHRRRLHASKWGVSYDPCLEKQSDHEIYELSLENPDADYWHKDMRPDLGAPGFHNCDKQAEPRGFHYLVPPVCKQLWTEASDCAWKTTTFAFVTSGDLQHFVHFSGARLNQVRQLCLISPGMDFFIGRPIAEKEKFERGWERALKSGAMREFTSLIGLHLVLRSFWGASRWDVTTVEDLEFPPDECLYLPEIIRVFQQFRLRSEYTTVLVTNAEQDKPYGYVQFTVPKRRKMAQVIRNFILQRTPDRDWNGPGQRMVIWPHKSESNDRLT